MQSDKLFLLRSVDKRFTFIFALIFPTRTAFENVVRLNKILLM